MVPTTLRFLRATILLALILPLVVLVCNRLLRGSGLEPSFWMMTLGAALLVLAATVGLARAMRRLSPTIESLAAGQARFLDEIAPRRVPLAIVASAALSLFLELAIIRWQGTEWEVFAFYKNFGLLACFLGLGLGYALASGPSIPGVLVLPVLAMQLLFLIALRHGMPPSELISLQATPIAEQLNMGVDAATQLPHTIAVYFFLTVVILMTTLAFIPVGQICGRLVERLRHLEAYGWNLTGSIVGVLSMFVASFLWTPPILWFALAGFVLLLFQIFDRRALLAGLATFFVIVAVLAWPVASGSGRIYSPYQLLELGPGDHGLMMIRAAGHYFQRIHDLSPAAQSSDPDRKRVGEYYELPYQLHPFPRRVAIVGAGTGNDVAAALRRGAERIDAIEIDPAIVDLGVAYHPERPYEDERVRRVVDDARTFLRRTRDSYDLIVYGLLDSHTLLSHTSSVRLDSFVYTVEGLRDARARLDAGGVVSLSFSVLSEEIGRKIYLMMQEAFEGNPPVCIYAEYDGSVIFAQSKEGDLRLGRSYFLGTGFEDRSARYANPALKADVSTDDWPFFYMPQRIYPRSYVGVVGLVLVLSLVFFAGFVRARPRPGQGAFFFLGAGFMLVETKAITELGLAFGNTWHVIGIVIAAILIMAWLGNWIVDRFRIRSPWIPFVLLVGSVGLGLVYSSISGIGSTPGAQVVGVIVLTCPLLFSGIVFSTLFAKTPEASSALGMNLVGAIAGGLLEYNSMYFGFRFLYWIAIGLYGAAFIVWWLQGRRAGALSRS